MMHTYGYILATSTKQFGEREKAYKLGSINYRKCRKAVLSLEGQRFVSMA